MDKEDFRRIKEKYRNFLQSNGEISKTENGKYQKMDLDIFEIRDSGKGLFFADIDYENKFSSRWITRFHLSRLRDCLIKDDLTGLKADDPKIKTYMGLFDFWLYNKFSNPNWWHPQIGTPQLVLDIWFILEEYMTPEEKKDAEEICLTGSYRQNKEIERWGGANLIWGAQNTLLLAVLTEDDVMMKWAVERAMKEVAVKDGGGEGIKPDMSFYQHGALLYSFGYGRSFVNELTKMFMILSGSEYMPPKEKTDLFERFVLDGCRYFTVNCFCDFMTVGREISREVNTHIEDYAGFIDRMLATKEFTRKDELLAFRKSLALEKKESSRGVKAFPNSYFITGYNGNSYFSAKGISTKYICQEAGNQENYLGINFCDGGTVCIMRDGSEYADISPLWDFSLIPGVTSLNENEEELLVHTGNNCGWFARTGRTDNCSVKTAKGMTILSMKLKHGPVTGYLTRIIGDGFLILCGNEINVSYDASAAEKDPRETFNMEGKILRTCINQCHASEDCFLSDGESVSVPINASVKNGGFIYKNLGKTSLVAEMHTVRGRWEKNNRQVAGLNPECEGKLFTIYADHGPWDTVSDGDYAVIVSEEGSNVTAETFLEHGCHKISVSGAGNAPITVTVNFEEESSEILLA